MVMNDGAIQGFTTFLETLRNRLNDARTRLADAEAEVGRLNAQTQSVEDSIAAYREYYNVPIPAPLVNGAHGDTTLTDRRRSFLRDWARRNGGRLVRREVRDSMIQVGLYRDALQFRQQFGGLMEHMECWDRIRGQRGAYRLVSPNGQEH